VVYPPRLADPHSVVNGGNIDRFHMVINAMVNDWIAEVLQHTAGALRPCT
jgi:hypothetical protein